MIDLILFLFMMYSLCFILNFIVVCTMFCLDKVYRLTLRRSKKGEFLIYLLLLSYMRELNKENKKVVKK